MKRPTKIIISIIVVAGIAGAGIMAINKNNEKIYQESLSLQPKKEVKKGDLLVTVTSSGNIVFNNEDSKNINDLKVKIDVDELDINKIKNNQIVEIKSDAFPNEIFKGRVINIAKTGTVENGKAKYGVEISLPKTISEVGNINKNEVNLRVGASKDFELIKVINKDLKVNIINTISNDKKEKWYQVSLEDGTIGWVNSYNVDIIGISNTNVEAIIKNDTVSIKKEASSKSDVLTKLVKDDVVTVIGKNKDNYKVKLSDGKEGWVKDSELIIEKLKPGMSVTASIIVNSKKDALYVPIECVVKTDDGYVVVMSDSNKVKAIKTGINSEDYIEVVEGLSEGDKVKIIDEENDTLNISGVENLMPSDKN